MGLDFYGISLTAQLQVPTTSGKLIAYDLWMNNSDDIGLLPTALRDMAYVEAISIQIGLAMNSKVSVTFSMPLEEGLELINTPLINWAGSELLVQIGYSTGSPELRQTPYRFGGLVMKPDVRVNGSGVTVTLSALGLAYGMYLSNATSTRSYVAGTSPWEAVKETLARNLIDVSREDLIFPDFPNPRDRDKTTAKHPFFKSIKSKITKNGITTEVDSAIEKGAKNDWWFVSETIKNYALDIFVVDKQFTIRDPEKWKAEKSKYTFVLKGAIDSDKHIYPILEFNSPSSFVWLAQGIGGSAMRDISSDKKEELEKLITTSKKKEKVVAGKTDSERNAENFEALRNNALTFANTALGTDVTSLARSVAGTLSAFDFHKRAEAVPVTRTAEGAYNSSGGRDAASVFPGSPDDNRADMMISELKNMQQSHGIMVDIQTLGIPTLLPGMVVYVDGLTVEGKESSFGSGKGFNGNYGILLVEHDISASGMLTKFKGLNNFYPPEHGVGAASEGVVNQSEPPDSNGNLGGFSGKPTDTRIFRPVEE